MPPVPPHPASEAPCPASGTPRDNIRLRRARSHRAGGRVCALEPAGSVRSRDGPTGVVATPLLSSVTEGDLLLIGARPGQGKTLLGLRLLLEAAEAGRRAVFFTLEYTEVDTHARLAKLQGGPAGSTTAPRGSVGSSAGGIEIVASDGISAATIAAHLEASPHGTVAVIDYLQILGQDRRKPTLGDQMDALRQLARTRGSVLAVLSQIDRRFDAAGSDLPTMDDVRLPNPVAMATFTKTCFLHAGQVRFGNG